MSVPYKNDKIPLFGLVSMPRNGTHYLRSLLNSHPDVDISPEIFIAMFLCKDGNGGKNLTIWKNQGEYSNLTTRNILDRVYQKHNGLLVHAYQTRAKLDGAGDPEPGYKHNDLWDIFQRDRKISKFIYLKRRNALQVYVSQVKANKHRRWQMYDPNQLKENDFKIEFNAKRFFGYTKYFQEKHEFNFKRRFCIRKKVLKVYYEDIAANPQKECEKMLTFLGLETNGHEFKPLTLKQEKKKMREVISNFDEACRTLKGTEYEEFLDT